MYKNLIKLDEVDFMSNVTDLKNALRWYIRHCNKLEEALGKDKH